MAHIFVIAGHGAGDPGACGNGYQEAERVRALASKIAEYGGSNVTLGDMNRNYYADNGIMNLTIPSDWQIIELHMDSGVSSARGGHVIIKAGYTADKYDNALAGFIGSILPGRAQLIVGRSGLANVNRAAAKGYGYRLVEFGFISNSTDVSIFNSKLDDIAKGVLKAFDIPVKEDKPKTPLPDVLKGYTDLDGDAWYIDALAEAVEKGWLTGYSNGKMGATDPITRGQAVCVIARMADAKFEHPYSDVVASPYYYDAVAWAKENGIITGGDDGTFRPNNACTRAEFVTMLCRWKNGKAKKETADFKDWGNVPEYAKNAVAWAKENGIMSGDKAEPNKACTRAEAAVMLTRVK